MPMWKRVAGVVLLLAVSVWLAAMGLQTIVVTCEQRACVHEVRYAGITTQQSEFHASTMSLTWKRSGKYNNQGSIVILSASGEQLTVGWLSPARAEQAVTDMIQEPSYRLEATGPRWWLLFLFLTVPFMWSLVVPPKLRIPALVSALPVARTRKAARAARGKAKRDREQGTDA